MWRGKRAATVCSYPRFLITNHCLDPISKSRRQQGPALQNAPSPDPAMWAHPLTEGEGIEIFGDRGVRHE